MATDAYKQGLTRPWWIKKSGAANLVKKPKESWCPTCNDHECLDPRIRQAVEWKIPGQPQSKRIDWRPWL